MCDIDYIGDIVSGGRCTPLGVISGGPVEHVTGLSLSGVSEKCRGGRVSGRGVEERRSPPMTVAAQRQMFRFRISPRKWCCGLFPDQRAGRVTTGER